MTTEPVEAAVRAALASMPEDCPKLVGFSGGMDSHALLHALASVPRPAGEGSLRALHVNHGLHSDADQWETHCQTVCDALAVPLRIVRVEVPGAGARGPEAAARQARYRVFADALGENELLCLAHHLEDQAETFLLRLLRGAGPRGLSAMAPSAPYASGALLRPLLEVPRDAIRDYAERNGLRWIEDPGNTDTRFDRNYLRHQVMPRLRERWPGAAKTIARAAAHQATLARTAGDLGEACSDLAAGGVEGTLDCARLAALGRDAAGLAVRAWLARRGFGPPPADRLQRIHDEVVGAAEDANPLVAWNGVEVRRYRGRLYAMAPLESPEAANETGWDFRGPLVFPHGRLEAFRVTGAGLGADRVPGGRVTVRFRQGGERCRPAGEAGSSSLKQWFQRRGIPPWERDRMPLIYAGAELAAVAGAWVCAGYECAAGEAGWLIDWRASPAADHAGV